MGSHSDLRVSALRFSIVRMEGSKTDTIKFDIATQIPAWKQTCYINASNIDLS